MSVVTKLSNFGLKLALNYCFPLNATPELMRKRFDKFTGASREKLQKQFPNATFESVSIKERPAELIGAGKDSGICILYLHGGGYFSGSIRAYRRFLLKLAYRCQAQILIVDYRLAPEHPYPAALDDAQAAFLYLQKRFSNSKIIVGGDSAGGGLALATLLKMRDQNQNLPDRVFCISPWADLQGTGRSLDYNDRNDVWLSRKHLTKWAPWYHTSNDPKLPYLSPVYGNLKNCPPILLMAGDQEVLLDDSTRLYEIGLRDGCRATLHIGRGMHHDWFLSLPWLSESKKALSVLYGFVRSEV